MGLSVYLYCPVRVITPYPPMGLPTGKKGIYNKIVHFNPGVAVL